MRRIFTSCSLLTVLSLAVLLALGATQPAQQSKAKAAKGGAAMTFGNSDSISQEELKVYEYFLASDQLEGRNLPSRGYDVAALYVASHLAEWGLKPGGSRSDTNGPLQPYFMPIELISRQVVPEESKASMIAPATRGGFGGGGGGGGAAATGELRTVEFEYGKDWSAGGGGFRGPTVDSFDGTGTLIFAGNGYVINKTNANPYDGLDVRGKFIVVAGVPPELAALQAGGPRGGGGGGAQNPLGQACTDYFTPEQYAAKNGALAVIRVATFQQLSAMVNPNPALRVPPPNGPNFQVVKFQQQSDCPSAPSFTAGLALTNTLFQGERTNAAQVFYAAGSNAKQNSLDLNAAKKLTLHLAVRSEAGHGENVLGILEGSDPVLKNEYVVMSAHLDHIGLSNPQPDGDIINNGADDDGSGSCALLAIARAYAEGAAKGLRPKRSIIFLWNAGEEKGLWGSRYFNQFPFIDLRKVVADLNMDMIGRAKSPGFTDSNTTHVLVKPGEVLLVGPNVSSDELNKTIEDVNAKYQKMVLNHFYDTTAPDATHDNLGPQPNGQRIFYRSDHYNFARMGIPVAFFTTGLHPDYHRPSDSPDKIDYQEMQQISKTVAAVGWVLANQAGRPKLNEKLPDQLVRDMKTAQDQGWGKLTPVLPPIPGMPF